MKCLSSRGVYVLRTLSSQGRHSGRGGPWGGDFHTNAKMHLHRSVRNTREKKCCAFFSRRTPPHDSPRAPAAGWASRYVLDVHDVFMIINRCMLLISAPFGVRASRYVYFSMFDVYIHSL